MLEYTAAVAAFWHNPPPLLNSAFCNEGGNVLDHPGKKMGRWGLQVGEGGRRESPGEASPGGWDPMSGYSNAQQRAQPGDQGSTPLETYCSPGRTNPRYRPGLWEARNYLGIITGMGIWREQHNTFPLQK